jgi:hypothetical protein
MVWGRPDDPDGRALSWIEAAHAVGMQPPILRRYLDRPEFVSLLLKERRAFRTTICAGNEGALRKVRDRPDGNDMARVRAVLALEEMNADAGGARSMSDAGSRFTVQIVNRIAAPEPPAITISARTTIPAPFPSTLVEPEPEPPPPEPIFTPRRWP